MITLFQHKKLESFVFKIKPVGVLTCPGPAKRCFALRKCRYCDTNDVRVHRYKPEDDDEYWCARCTCGEFVVTSLDECKCDTKNFRCVRLPNCAIFDGVYTTQDLVGESKKHIKVSVCQRRYSF